MAMLLFVIILKKQFIQDFHMKNLDNIKTIINQKLLKIL